jgi:hypothetical protein
MPHAIAKRSFLFIEGNKALNPDKPVLAGRRHTLTATPGPQEIPDWLVTDPAFLNAVKVGEIQLLTMATSAAATSAEKPAKPRGK